MPLIKPVTFKAILQKGNRVQIPRLIRWQFKMEAQQVLKVTVKPEGALGVGEEFYARMNKDGRITIPRLTLELLQDNGESLVGYALVINVEPAELAS